MSWFQQTTSVRGITLGHAEWLLLPVILFSTVASLHLGLTVEGAIYQFFAAAGWMWIGAGLVFYSEDSSNDTSGENQ